jgi:hypothetical protein
MQADAGGFAEQPVQSDLRCRPQIVGDFQRCNDDFPFRFVVLEIVVGRRHEQVVELLFIEAGEGWIEVGDLLQVGDEVGQFAGVPVAADFGVIEGDVQRLFAFERQVDDDAIDVRPAAVFEDFDSLMSADEMAGAAVPDKRLDEVELVQRAGEFLEPRVARLERTAGIVGGGLELGDGESLDVHAIVGRGWLVVGRN